MPLYFHTEDVEFVLKQPARMRRWINNILASYNKRAGNINFIFCSDNYLLELNKKHLRHDYYTDVITFDQSETEEIISGDMYISVDRVSDNCGGYSFEEELHRVMIHGILHLLGFSDKSPAQKKQMRKLEDYCLAALSALK